MAKFHYLTPKVGDHVDVGGCVGKITEIGDKQLRVEGVYYDYDDNDSVSEDPWSISYTIEDFDNSAWWMLEGVPRWDARHIKGEEC